MLFWKCGCLVDLENRIFRKLISVDRKKKALTTEMNFRSYFHFKWIPERERERERERESAREEGELQSSPTIADDLQSSLVQSISSTRCRSQSREAPRRSLSREALIGAMLCEIAIDASWDRAIDRDLAFARSRSTLREISVACDLTKHHAVEPSRASTLVEHCAVERSQAPRRRTQSSVSLGLSFPSSFPNTRKYFSENFLKYNQTHENIFLSEKWNIFRKCFYMNQTQPKIQITPTFLSFIELSHSPLKFSFYHFSPTLIFLSC